MNQAAIVALLSTIAMVPAIAAPEGAVDSEGTIHIGIKLGPSNVVSSSIGMGIYGGYTIFGKNAFQENDLNSKLSVAAEAEYVDLGTSSISQLYVYKASVLGVAGAITYPVNEEFSAIVKAGLSRITQTTNCGQMGCVSASKMGVHVGAAWQYRVSPLMSLRAGYDAYPDAYSMKSVSIIYRYY